MIFLFNTMYLLKFNIGFIVYFTITLEKRGNSEIKIGFTIICNLETTMTGSHNTSIQKQTKFNGVNPNTVIYFKWK